MVSLLPQHTNPMVTETTADQAFVREVNLSLILRLVYNEAPLSRAQLATTTGLNKSTVSSLVEELLARQLVHETGINPARTGRPATLLEINPRAGGIIGVELGVDFVSVALADFRGNILWRKQANTDPAEAQEKTLHQTLILIKEGIAASRKIKLPLIGIGLAMPGTVDLEKGVLIFAPNLDWHNVPLREIFSKPTGLSVFVENDANAAAIAEHLFGEGRKNKNFIFVFAGVGIGGGLFLNGQLYRGKNGFAGEIGHSPITAEPSQAPCHCGNHGCWETYANQSSIIRRMQARLEAKRNGPIPAIDVPLSISGIKQAADAGNTEAIDSFSEAGFAMGQGFAGLINIFNPEKIILGGPLSLAGDYLIPAIKDAVDKHTLPEIDQQVEVSLSTFGSDASLIGAIAIVVNDILLNPSQLERR